VDPLAGEAADHGDTYVGCHVPDRTLAAYMAQKPCRRSNRIRIGLPPVGFHLRDLVLGEQSG
jgi:hypothetical protein